MQVLIPARRLIHLLASAVLVTFVIMLMLGAAVTSLEATSTTPNAGRMSQGCASPADVGGSG
jgi:hypothetical protein